MVRRSLCWLAACALLLACSGNDRPPAIDLDPAQSSGGAPDNGDDGPSGGKMAANPDLRHGGFINLPQVSDILWDDRRSRLYVSTTQGGLATVNLETGKISSQKIGDGPLLGLDLSPTGNLLAICENSVNAEAKQYWIHVADLENNTLREIYFDQFYENQEGTHDAAFANERTLFLASSFTASGYVPLVQVDLDHDTYEELPAVVSDTMFARSRDNSTVAMAEPKDGTGPVHVVDTSTLEVTDGYVQLLLHDVDINRDASKLAFPGPGQVKLRSRDNAGAYTIETTIIQTEREARAVVFSPVSDSIYVTWGPTMNNTAGLVERYNAETLESEGIVQDRIKLAGARAGGFVPTRMKISEDGTLLFITVETGINVIEVEP